MKKSILYTGIGYLLFGMLCIGAGIFLETSFEGLLWGFGGAGIGPGVVMLWKYFYWGRPGKREEYAERLKNERIEMRDERKIMLRDKSGRITYLIMTGVYLVLAVVFCICVVGGWLMPFARYLVFLVCGLLLFQYLCGIFVFRHLDNKL